MKRYMILLSVAALALAIVSAGANPLHATSPSATWEVATVHGANQFTISPDASMLHYNVQPRNTEGWYWDNNNGSDPGTPALNGANPSGLDPAGYRIGSRTFATTDVAMGQALNSLKLQFEYNNSLGGYVTINYFLTDGNGKFGIFAPTSLGIAGVSTTEVIDSNWNRITLDLTASIPDSTNVAVYEHNQLSTEITEPFTTMQWGDIKGLAIAGMYDYQRSPALGWGHWGTMFDEVNVAGDSAIVNTYGLALIWGDTVGNTTYTVQQREIRNVVVSFSETDYIGSFSNATVPEPGTIALLTMAGLGLLAYVWRRRAKA